MTAIAAEHCPVPSCTPGLHTAQKEHGKVGESCSSPVVMSHQAPAAQQQRHSQGAHSDDNHRQSHESTATTEHHRAQTLEVQQIKQSENGRLDEHATCDAPTFSADGTSDDLGDKGDERASDSDEARGFNKQHDAVEGKAREPRPPGSIKQRRREKRKVGWERKKQLVKAAKKMKRQGRCEE